MSPEEWYHGLPTVARHYFTIAVVTTVLVSLNIVPINYLYLDFDLVFKKFQVWRLFTVFIFFGKFGLPWIFQMYMLQRHVGNLESGYFQGLQGLADMLTLLLFNGSLLLLMSFFFGTWPFMGSSMVFSCIYVWSRKDPYRQTQLLSFTFKAWHFPFVMMLFSVLLGNSPKMDMLGIVVGHVYHFLMDIVPHRYNRKLLSTPAFLFNLVSNQTIQRPNAGWQRGQGNRMN
jgi:Derlin-2/3